MALSDPTVRIKLVGQELRRCRIAAGMRLTAAAEKIGLDHTRLSRMETGKYHQNCDDVAGLLAIYGITGSRRREILQLCRDAEASGLWQRYCSYDQRLAALKTLESHTKRLINFEWAVIPGLLQTVPYAQALFGNSGIVDEDEVGKRVTGRIQRQAVLRTHRGAELLAIIAEPALHNVVGDKETMREQLVYLREASKRQNITIRIIPTSARSYATLGGPFMRMHFRDSRGVVLLENRTSNLFLENENDLLTYNQVTARLLDAALDNVGSEAFLRDREEQLT